MQDFRKLNIYKRAIEYCTKIYKFSTKLPSNEKYGLIPQIRRAAISVPLNISEGSGCNTDKEFSQFISYAYRSVNEVLTCLELSIELKLVNHHTFTGVAFCRFSLREISIPFIPVFTDGVFWCGGKGWDRNRRFDK